MEIVISLEEEKARKAVCKFVDKGSPGNFRFLLIYLMRLASEICIHQKGEGLIKSLSEMYTTHK